MKKFLVLAIVAVCMIATSSAFAVTVKRTCTWVSGNAGGAGDQFTVYASPKAVKIYVSNKNQNGGFQTNGTLMPANPHQNANYLYYQLDGDNSGESYQNVLSLEKKAFTSAPKANAVWRARGEGYFYDYFVCVPAKN